MPYLLTLLLSLFFFYLPAQIINGDFSEWNEPLGTSGHEEELIQIGAIHPARGTPLHWQSSTFGVCRIEEGCKNDFGAVLYSQYHGDPAFLKQTIPVTANPNKLLGCYKSILYDLNDTALIRYVNVLAKKENEIIGSGQWSFVSTNDYTHFEVSINYDSPEIADSITVSFHSDVTGSIEYPMDGIFFLDGIALDYTTNTSEISALGSKNFLLYPNPIQHSLFINSAEKGDYTYRIFNTNGRLIKQGKLQERNNLINTARLEPGLYLIHVMDKDEVQEVGKFLKI